MTFATNLQATANRLLTNYGQAIGVMRDVVSGYVVETGDVVEGLDISYTGYGHPSPYTSENIASALVQQGDIRLVFYSTTQPLVNDLFTIDGIVYTAMAVNNKKAQGLDIYYEVQLRK